MPMNVTLPNCNVQIPPLGIGCAYLTSGSVTRHDERLVRAAFEAGARHFDVAPQYGLGSAERVLGRALRGQRSEVTIASKYGLSRPQVCGATLAARAALGPARVMLRRALPGVVAQLAPRRGRVSFAVGPMLASLQDSLAELGTDYLDLLLLHMPRREDIDDTFVKALVDLRDAGRVKSIGVAAERAEGQAIIAAFPGVFDVVQHSWCVFDPPLVQGPRAPLRITHRGLAQALGQLRSAVASDLHLAARLSEALGEDIRAPGVLSGALIGASLAENPGGITLVSSRSITRTQENVLAGLRSDAPARGHTLLKAVQGWAALPKVQA